MSWLAILLALASLGGGGHSSHRAHHKHGCKAKQHHCKPAPKKKKPQKQRRAQAPAKPAPGGAPRVNPAPEGAPPAKPAPGDAPPATAPAPDATPAPGATATPTPAPVFPRRTAVDLLEWDVRSSYPVLAAGRVTFNAKNLGEDDHNLSVRGGGRDYGGVDLAPGDTAALSLELPPGTYTLYCPLPDHEAAGMRTEIRIR
ncbi:MAG TPA: hypothetical protein VFG79_22670 [Solirubrobacter sp.]|nr:hypothetical protein [Solirubrobacter sp.]